MIWIVQMNSFDASCLIKSVFKFQYTDGHWKLLLKTALIGRLTRHTIGFKRFHLHRNQKLEPPCNNKGKYCESALRISQGTLIHSFAAGGTTYLS